VTRTLIVRLQGGSGNQLFQYAAGLALAEKWAAQPVWLRRGAVGIPLAELVGGDLSDVSPLALERAGMGPHLSAQFTSGARRALTDKVVSRGRRRLAVGSGRAVSIVQPSARAFSPQIDTPPDRATDIYLEGYFQNPQHFGPTLTQVADQVAAQLIEPDDAHIGSGATVVSFRRGDYIPLGWDLPLAYYERALAALPPVDGPVWAIADDQVTAHFALHWLRSLGLRAEPPPDLGVKPVIRDLRLLMAAERVVMANSTLCWWGTTVGDRVAAATTRVVLAPSPWLPIAEAAALLQPSWQVVDSNP